MELITMIDELGDELRKEHRESAREAAQRALEKGHEEADHMRAQASKMTTGAIISAGITAAGAGFQAYGASSIGSDATQSELARGQAWVNAGGSTAQLGQFTNGIAQGCGTFDAADARRAAADAQAANQRASLEDAAAAEAQNVVDRATDTYGQILSLEHQANMAAIGRV